MSAATVMRRSQRTPKKPLKYLDSELSPQKNEENEEGSKVVASPSKELQRRRKRNRAEDEPNDTQIDADQVEPKLPKDRLKTVVNPKKEDIKSKRTKLNGSDEEEQSKKNASAAPPVGKSKEGGRRRVSKSRTDTTASTGHDLGGAEGGNNFNTIQCGTQTLSEVRSCSTQTELTSVSEELLPVQRIQQLTDVYIPMISDTGVKSLRRVKVVESEGVMFFADHAVEIQAKPESASGLAVSAETQSPVPGTAHDTESQTAEQLLLLAKPEEDTIHTESACPGPEEEPTVENIVQDPEIDVREYDSKDLVEEYLEKSRTEEEPAKVIDTEKVLNAGATDDCTQASASTSDDKLVECPACHRKFMTVKSMKNHQKIRCQKRAKGDRPFICEVCGKGFITKDDLRKHKLTHDKIKEESSSGEEDTEGNSNSTDGKEDLIFLCNTCGKSCKSAEHLVKHTKKHADGKMHACDQCPSKFKHESALQNHMKRHNSNDISCDECGKTFSNSSSLKAHIGLHDQESPYQCGVCGKGAGSLSNMKKHMEVHTQYRPHVCEYCGKTFRRKPALKEHERIHTGEKPFQCKICGKSFSLNNTLKMHIMRHSGERPHKCDLCGKGFLNTFMLRDHYRTHTGEKPYSCHICKKMFTTRANLSAHTKLHSGQRPFSCSICAKTFTSKAKMKMHEDSHSGVIKHNCPVCKKGFVRKDSLFSHLRIHRTDKTPSLCSICGNKYSSPAALRVHFKKHLDIKPFECSICSKAFTRSDVWKKHLEWHMKHLDDIPGNQLNIIEINPDQEDVQIVVEEDVHIMVDQENSEGKVEYVEIPISQLEGHENTVLALAQHEGQTEVIVTEVEDSVQTIVSTTNETTE